MAKGKAFLQHFLDTLPEVDTTAQILVALILLSSRLNDVVSPVPAFTRTAPKWCLGVGALTNPREVPHKVHVSTLAIPKARVMATSTLQPPGCPETPQMPWRT